MKRTISWTRVAGWVSVAVLVVITVAPFWWMLRTALSNNRALAAHTTSLLPAEFTLGAFKRVLGLQSQASAIAEGGSGAIIDFWLYLRNSVIVATTTTLGQVFFSALAAYAFARLRWPGRDKVFALFLAALLVPPIFTTLPNFVLMKDLGLLNTFPGIILPNFFMTPFAIFFLRQFFLGISREVEEAATIDGAGHLRIFFRIVLPMSAAPISDPVPAHLRQLVERLLLAATRRPGGQRPSPHRRTRRVPVPDTPGRTGLGRSYGGHPHRRTADPPAVPGLREAGRQFHRIHRAEIALPPPQRKVLQ